MKKVMCIALACVLVCVGLCGCGNSVDPVGEYANRQFLNVHNLYGSADVRFFAVTETEDGYAFDSPTYTGTAEVKDDMLVCTREDSGSKTLKESLDNGIIAKEVSYFIYEDYLVSEETSTELYEGDLPQGTLSEFIVTSSSAANEHVIAFNENGDCEVRAVIGGEIANGYGTYTVDGPMVNATITKEVSIQGKTFTGEYKFCLFIKDGKIYDTVYKKILNEEEQ